MIDCPCDYVDMYIGVISGFPLLRGSHVDILESIAS